MLPYSGGRRVNQKQAISILEWGLSKKDYFFFNLKSDYSISLFIYYACTNSVTPSLQQARVCPPNMLPEDGTNLYSARGILSFIQSSTRRAYQQVLDVLDENRR